MRLRDPAPLRNGAILKIRAIANILFGGGGLLSETPVRIVFLSLLSCLYFFI